MTLSDGYPGGFPSDDLVEAHFARAAHELEEAIASCHERVACPKCGVPQHHRCVRAVVAANRRPWWTRPTIKHPHAERIRAAGIPLR